jgi:hypothetical protein
MITFLKNGLFKFRFEEGAHVNPLGPDSIMLPVVTFDAIYFSLHIHLDYGSKKCCRGYACCHGYQGYQRSLIAVFQ